ncbi:MAG: zinc ABC transporter substrate-binding protein [Desulfobulbus sp.]|jgi:ABC-type Zn uptake system ZnuABC Zn-binding protein ZnuA|uniref:metal ABC transporter solute-binding protein, Zn/Mn family n=1 Tax=Desulfobulbus sp. TaxID=895 RepID=UPI002847D332|nr:zinc ABC transporter substrate-binding protein [Desulfobulbus sp.]MDR2551100.1 zinc ABC transporter substrate-binding protein [Desulfobulbus sp.]
MPIPSRNFLLPLLFSCCLALLPPHLQASTAEHKVRVLTTTFPLYQITRNISQGVEGVEIDLMIPAEMGCPHDYALTPQDMRKLARADVLIVNGLGMEEFLGAPIAKANPRLQVVDSSQGIGHVLAYTDAELGGSGHDHRPPGEGRDAKGHNDDDHHGQGPNPHLFASPRMAALLAANIADGLAQAHPAGAARYAANANAYEQRMNRLADDMAALGKRLANNRIVTQHGVFDYLARDMGLAVVAVIQAHPGQNPSAAEILDLVAAIKAKKAGALFTEPQYPEAIGATIAREAGIAAARLDPAANGPEQAPLDYYEQVMRRNMIVLEQTLGSH